MIDEGDFMNAENKNVKKLFILILVGLVFIIGFSFAAYNIVLEGNKEHSITTSKISFFKYLSTFLCMILFINKWSQFIPGLQFLFFTSIILSALSKLSKITSIGEKYSFFPFI